MTLESIPPIPETKPSKDINLVLGYGRVLESHEEKKGSHKVFVFLGLLVFLLFLLASLVLGSLGSGVKKPADTSSLDEMSTQNNQPPPSLVDPNDPTFWQTYTNKIDLFSFKYPREATIQKREPNPLPVAVAVKHDDPVLEISPGAEKPGWLLTVSPIQTNEKNLTLGDWAVEANLDVPLSAQETTLDGKTSLTWKSSVFPESYYLVLRKEGVVFIKIIINSNLAGKHETTVGNLLGTFRFLEKGLDPDLGLKWIRKQFGGAWDIEYPDSWEVDSAGIIEGRLTLSGSAEGQSYQVDFAYPNFQDEIPPGLPLTIDEWLGREVAKLSAPERDLVKTKNLKIAGTEARILTNYRQSGRLYLWQRASKKPSLFVVSQTSGEFNGEILERLLGRFAAGIR